MITDKIKYRFIGTKQDLIDNRFRVWGDTHYLRYVDGDDTLEVYINMDPLGERLVQNNLGDDDLIIPHIQDLIEKNLVKEVIDKDKTPIEDTRLGRLVLNILQDEQMKELRLWNEGFNKYKIDATTLEIPFLALDKDKDIIQHKYASNLIKGIIDKIKELKSYEI